MAEIIGITIVILVLIFWCVYGGSKGKSPALLLELTFNNIKIRGNIMAVSLTSTQFVDGVLQPVDSKGRPARVDEDSVVFTSSDGNVFTIERDATDELKFRVVAVGEGVAQLDYSADADLGDGIVSISGFTAVEVLPAMATNFGVTFSTPQEQEPGTTTSTTTL